MHVADTEAYPSAPWGAAWDGNTLMVDADSWNVEPDEVVAHARMALENWRREERAQRDERSEDVV